MVNQKIPSLSIDDMLNSVDNKVDHFLDGKEMFNGIELIHASNVIEWVVGSKFLNQPQLFDYTRQYQVMRDFFQLRCPLCNSNKPEDIDAWNKSQEYLESENLLTWNEKYLDDVCPKCAWTRRELEKEGLLKRYNTMVGCAGMRSGKSMTAGFIATWIEHNCLLVDNLQTYFDVIPKQRLENAFLATTGTQAKDTIYDVYTVLRDSSPWIQHYRQNLERIQLRDEFYKEYERGSIEYREKRLFMMSLNSNSSGLAGRTRVGGFIDELSRFDLSESKRSADEVFTVIDHSLLTVRAAARRKHLPNWVGLMICVSSPISENDKTMQLLKSSKKSKTIFTFHYGTLDFNPKITEEDLKDAYDTDELKAERDFGANPPGGENPLIMRWDDWFEKSCDRSLRPKGVFSPYTPVDSFGKEYFGMVLDAFTGDTHQKYYLSLDAGKNGDAFAMAMAHGEDIEDSLGIKRFFTVMDFIIHIKPVKEKSVYFKSMIDIFKKLKKKITIEKVQYDHWQSESQIQDLRDIGIWAEGYNIKASDYENMMTDGYMGILKFLPPIGNLSDDVKTMDSQTKYWWEAKCLERSLDLKRVDHPKKGSNDLIQVACGVHRLVSHSRMPESLLDKKEKTKHLFKKFTNRNMGMAGKHAKGFSRWVINKKFGG